MIVALKFIHYLALFLAGGLGVANGILAKNHQRAETPPAAPVQKSMMTLARLGLVALILLWVTGIALTLNVYGSFALGWAFHLKLLGATILLFAVSFLNIHLSSKARLGMPPNPVVMRVVPMASRGGLVLVLLGIAVVTTG